MLKINRELPSFRIGPKMGPKGVSPMEQRLWMLGFRCFGEKVIDVKISNKKSKTVRIRSYFRGKQCIKVRDILKHSVNVPQNV